MYFTSDTHRIYKGNVLYAATTFDQMNFRVIEAEGIKVGGKSVSLQGHTHTASEVTGVALSDHTHEASEINGLTEMLSDLVPIQFVSRAAFDAMATPDPSVIYFVDDNSIYKGSELYGAASFDQLEYSTIDAKTLTVDGQNVSLEGHTHTLSDIASASEAIAA